MSRIITIIVIILALGGAIVLGYKAFFSAETPTSTVGTTSSVGSTILPQGSELDFATVQKYNKDDRIFQYPVVSPSEIGPEIGVILTQ